MAYKRYVKRGGKVCGPYYYESYRDKYGKVRKRYVGTTLPTSKKHVVPTNKKHFTKLKYDTKMLFVSHKLKSKIQKNHKKIQIILAISLLALVIIISYNYYNNLLKETSETGKEPGNLFSINFLRQMLLDLGILPENLTTNLTEAETPEINVTPETEAPEINVTPEVTTPVEQEIPPATEPETSVASTERDIGVLSCNPISACDVPVNTGENCLTKSITDTNNCLKIIYSDAILDCQGFTINGGYSSTEAILIENTGVTIKNCIITGPGDGIEILKSNAKIINNTISVDGKGIYLIAPSGVNVNDCIIENNTISSSYDIGIYFHGSSSGNVDNNNLTNNKITSGSILKYGIGFHYAESNLIKDSVIEGGAADVNLDSSSNYYSNNNVLLNCTLTHNTTTFNDAYGNLIRKWYYQVYVNDSNGNKVPNANVSVYCTQNADGCDVGKLMDKSSTDSSGKTKKMILSQYIQDINGLHICDNYTAIATNITRTSSHSVIISGNNLTDYFTFDVSPLTISIIYPQNNVLYGINVLNLNYTLSNITKTNRCWYSNGTWNSTYTVPAGTNFTNVISKQGNNNWTVYCNDTYGYVFSSSVAFIKDTTPPNIFFDSYTYTDPFVGTITTPTETNGTYVNRSYIDIYVNATDNNSLNKAWLQWENSNSKSNETLMEDPSSGGLYIPNPKKYNILDDQYNFTAFANDPTGNLNSTEKRTVTVDTKYPLINFTYPTPPNNNFTRASSLYVNVSVYDKNFANITFYLYNNTNTLTLVNRTNYSSAYIIGNSTRIIWTLPTDAIYYYNVSVIDLARNINYTQTRNITRDTINPRIFFNFPSTNRDEINRNCSLVNVTVNDTNTNTVWLQWETPAGLITNVTIIPNPDHPNTYWLNETGLTATGMYFYTVFVNDSAGNVNQTPRGNVTIDLNIPEINFVYPTPPNNAYNNTDYLFVNVSFITKNFANITYSLYNISYPSTPMNKTICTPTDIKCVSIITNTSNITWRITNDTTYFYNVSINNSAGNTANTSTRTFTRDTTYPIIFFNPSTDTNMSYLNRNWTFINITASDTYKNTIWFQWENSTGTKKYNESFSYNTGNIYWINKTNLIDGVYNFTAFVNDSAGNVNRTDKYTIIIDTITPAINIITPANVFYPSNNIIFELSTSQADSGAASIIPILDDSLVSWWRMDEVYNYQMTNYVIDYTARNNLTINNAKQVNGKFGKAMYFDSTINSNLVGTDNLYPNSYNPRTISLWFKTNRTQDQKMLSYGTRNLKMESSIGFYLNNIGFLTFDSTTDLTIPAAPYTDNKWHHILYSYNGTNETLYLDGIPKISKSIITLLTNPIGTFTIGSFNTNIEYFNGSIDNAMIFNRSLNPQEVLGLYNATRILYLAQLEEKTHSFSAYSEDYAGNLNFSNKINFTIDTIYPLIFFNYPETDRGFLSRNYMTININATDTNKFSIWFQWENSTGKYNETFTDNNSLDTYWTTKYNLANGLYNFTAFINDSTGHFNSTIKQNVTIDATIPGINFTFPTPPNNTYKNTDALFMNVSVNNINFANITFTLYNNTNALTQVNQTTYYTLIKGSSNITWKLNADAIYYYNITTFNLAGNSNTTEKRTFTRDTKNPLISYGLKTAPDYANFSRDWIYVNVSVNETNPNNITFTLWNNNEEVIVNSTTFSMTNYKSNNTINWTSLDTNGIYYQYQVSITDKANNQNSTPFRYITLDTIPPDITIISPVNTSEYSSNSIDFNVSVSDVLASSSCLFSLDNSANYTMTYTGNNYFNYTKPIKYGYHNITFSCNDSANNWNSATTTRFWNKNIPPPNITGILFSMDNFATYTTVGELNRKIQIKIIAEDNENLDLSTTKVYIRKLDGTTLGVINAVPIALEENCLGPNLCTNVNFTANFTPDTVTTYIINASVNNSVINGQYTYINYSEEKNFDVSGSTALILSSNYSNKKVNVSTVDLTNKGIAYINYTISNTGQTATYSPNLTISGIPTIISTVVYQLSDIPIGGAISKVAQVNITKFTAPEEYTATATLFWKNPDNTIGIDTYNIGINVLENRSFILTPSSIPLSPVTSINPGETSQFIIEINNTGNVDLFDFNLSCNVGQPVCDKFKPLYNDSHFNLNKNTSRKVEMTLTCPYDIISQNYYGEVNVSEQTSSKIFPINIFVPEKFAWDIYPESINVSKGYGQAGVLQEVQIRNLGTKNMNNILLSSTNSPVVSPNMSVISVSPGKSANITLNYNSPAIPANYPLTIIIDNINGVPTEKNITINFSSTPLKADIISQSLSDVISEKSVLVLTNATYSNIPLTASNTLNWEIFIGDKNCYNVNSVYTSNFWQNNCTAPDLPDGRNYDLTARVNYPPFGDAEKKLIGVVYYKDITPPLINHIKNNINKSENINVKANITDNVLVSSVTSKLIFPNGSIIDLTLTPFGGYYINNNLVLYNGGEYLINYTAIDSTGNINSTIGWFEVYDKYLWTIKLVDYASNPVRNINISLNKPYSAEVLLNNKTDSNGEASFLVNKRQYDIEGKTPDKDFIVRNVNFTNITITNTHLNFHEANGSDLLIQLYTPYRGIVSNSTGFENNNFYIAFNYANLNLEYNQYWKLAILKCSSWNYAEKTCTSSWKNISSTNDYNSKIISGNDVDFATYFIAENMCGDGQCDTYTFGEDTTTCPADCKSDVVNPPDGGGGGSSGGGGGGGTTTPIVAQNIGGIQLETTSIYKEMFPGESTTARIKVKNTLAQKKDISLRGSGKVAQFIFFGSSTITLEPNEEKDILITLVASKDIAVGNYDGDIILKSGDKEGKISATVKILSPENKLLDLKIQPLVSTIPPGEVLKVQTDLINLGKSNKIDVQFDLQLLDINTGKIIARNEEKISLQTSLSTIKNLTIPLKIKTGKYMLKGIAYYSNPDNEKLQANSIAYVTVDYPILQRKILGIPVWNYLILLAVIIAIFAVIRYINMLKNRKKRFKISIDMSKLPQPGPNAGFIGKVAETGIRTFIDMNKLQMHTLVAGSTGSGKTVAAQGIIEEALLHKKSVIIFDPTAQWTGFFRKTDDKTMLNRYKYFEMKEKDAKGFNGTIKTISDPYELINIKKYLDLPGEITIFNISRLTPKEIDIIVASTIEQVFKSEPDESKELKTLIVYDEVHRLLPKFGGSGQGFVQLERGAREFRKWGIGLLLISQVLSDFVGEIKANIGTEIQMGTRYEGDLERVNMKYGEDILKSVVKEPIGTGMMTNAEYNNGRPYFVSFRPLLHTTKRLSNTELAKYENYFSEVEDLEYQMSKLEEYGIDILDLKLEIKLAKNKIKEGQFQMADMYLETLRPRFAEHWKNLNKTPEHIVKEKISKEEVVKGIETAKEEREKFLKTNPPPELSLVEEIKRLRDLIETQKRKGKITNQVENKLEDFKNRLKPFFGKKLNPKDAEGIKYEIKLLNNEINKL